MENTRLQKVGRLIQKELSEMFLLQTKGSGGDIISVTSVRVSPDLGVARVYLSIFPSGKGKEIIQHIQDNTKSIRFNLGQRIRMQVRKIPELTFYIDDSLDYMENIDHLLQQ